MSAKTVLSYLKSVVFCSLSVAPILIAMGSNSFAETFDLTYPIFGSSERCEEVQATLAALSNEKVAVHSVCLKKDECAKNEGEAHPQKMAIQITVPDKQERVELNGTYFPDLESCNAVRNYFQSNNFLTFDAKCEKGVFKANDGHSYPVKLSVAVTPIVRCYLGLCIWTTQW